MIHSAGHYLLWLCGPNRLKRAVQATLLPYVTWLVVLAVV